MIRNQSSVGSRVIGGACGGREIDIVFGGVEAWPQVMYLARALRMELR